MKSPSISALCISSILLACGTVQAQSAGAHPVAGGQQAKEYPPFDSVIKGLKKVVSTADGSSALYDLYKDAESGRLVAVLPRNFDSALVMIACTISGGDSEAGVMGPTYYAKWRKINRQLALVAPNINVRTEGDKQAQDSVDELYTGRVIVSTPVLAMAPGNRPVIDLGRVCTAQSSKFFGATIYGAYGPSYGGLNPALATLTKAKAFPENVIFEYEAPRADGQLVRLTYNFGALDGTPGFKPRRADPRVGYFYDWHQDFARPSTADVTDRYIARWSVEKRDPSLSLSPPKEPIVWYIEHTAPVKYRRYIREGILLWNSAFEQIGIVNAVEVYQQDEATGAHMEKDPEDARYNFFRWNASDHGYAIGPSRTNPYTGEILDADVVWHQGLTRNLRAQLDNLSADLIAQSFGPETLSWLDEHPSWDPRVRLAGAAKREQMMMQREIETEKAATVDLHDHDHPWTHGINDPTGAACRMGNMLALDLSLADAALLAGVIDAADTDLLDGLPEEYLSSMIRYVSAHEVGHCIGLQHNMAASTIRSLDEINSPGFEGPTVGSVMDYVAANINHELGEVQGPWATKVLGPYDHWAIAYGYGPESELDEVLAQVSEPDHIFVAQMAMMSGSDPRNMTWDMGSDNLDFAESRAALAAELRSRLIEDVIKDGQSWKVARDRLASLMGTQLQVAFIASNWIGGSFINNDFKGDPGNRPPIEDVPAAAQRRALHFIIDNTFMDEAYGLTPELLRHLGNEYWWDPAGIDSLLEDPSYDVHDVVGGVQATALTLVMNPTTLRRVYDNEYRAEGSDILTLSEVMTTVTDAVWTECDESKNSRYTADSPMVSSFRRNLQAEHVQRLIDLALLEHASSPALRTIRAMARQELRRIDGMATADNADPYTSAHLTDVRTRIERTMEAAYVVIP